MDKKLTSKFTMSRYKRGFSFPYVLRSSYAEPLSMAELLAMADDHTRKLWEEFSLGYTNPLGHPLLREEIAAFYDNIRTDDVLVSTGQEALYIATNCLVQYLQSRNNNSEAFHAVYTYPAYQPLYECLKLHNVSLSGWQAKLTNQGWLFDLEELKGLVQENTRLLVVNFPHNPTGYQPTVEQLQKLVDFCKERDIFIFYDEEYWFTNTDGTAALPGVCSLYEHSISLGATSKVFRTPGLRIGWLCTQNKVLLDMMSHFNDYLTYCPSAPGEILALIALRNRKKILGQTMEIIQSNVPILESFFEKHRDIFEYHRPVAGTTVFVRVKGWLLELGDGGDSGLCDILEEKKELLLLPSKVYHYKDEYVRIGFGKRNMKVCLDKLEEFLQENQN